MAHEHKLALESIVSLIVNERAPCYRMCRMYDIALTALGYTQNQRIAEFRKLSGTAISKYISRY